MFLPYSLKYNKHNFGQYGKKEDDEIKIKITPFGTKAISVDKLK